MERTAGSVLAEMEKMYFAEPRPFFLNGGYGERQFDLFKVWASCFEKQSARC